MKLRDWRVNEGLTLKQAGERIGRGGETWRRYELPPGAPDSRIPDHDDVVAIYRLTGGLVAPADFYDLPAAAGSPGSSTVAPRLSASALVADEGSGSPPAGRLDTSALDG